MMETPMRTLPYAYVLLLGLLVLAALVSSQTLAVLP